MARVGLPLTALVSSDGAPDDWPDLQIAASPFAMRTVQDMAANPGSPLSGAPGITFAGFHLRPKGRGQVRLRSAEPGDPPIVDPRHWADAFDRSKALALFRRLQDWAMAPALSRYVGAARHPIPAGAGDDEVLDHLRAMIDPGLHGAGTCTMGVDPATSVVDDQCRVHGIAGLRVVDCSIMPTPVSGNTNGSAMAIAWHAAGLIAER